MCEKYTFIVLSYKDFGSVTIAFLMDKLLIPTPSTISYDHYYSILISTPPSRFFLKFLNVSAMMVNV